MTAPFASQARARGFSLLEILVAMAIMGLLLAVAAPALGRHLEALSFDREADRVLRDVRALRLRALMERREIVFDPETPETHLGPLPERLRLSGDKIVFLSTGACIGGDLTVEAINGRRRDIALTPPRCAREESPPAGARR